MRTQAENDVVNRVYSDPGKRQLVESALRQPPGQAEDTLLSLLAEEHLAGWKEGAGWQRG